MAEFDLDRLLAEARAVTPTREQWFVPIQPEEDPFAEARPPWEGFRPPADPPLEVGRWLKDFAIHLERRVWAGAEYLERTDLSPADREKAERLFRRLSWQANLVAQIAKLYFPCERCPRVIGGSYPWEHPASGEMVAWQFKQHFEDAALPVTTPAGHQVTIVPWRTGRTDRTELTPQDVAALSRVGRLAGLDELSVLDRVLQREVEAS